MIDHSVCWKVALSSPYASECEAYFVWCVVVGSLIIIGVLLLASIISLPFVKMNNKYTSILEEIINVCIVVILGVSPFLGLYYLFLRSVYVL